MDRAFACGAKGCVFESRRGRHSTRFSLRENLAHDLRPDVYRDSDQLYTSRMSRLSAGLKVPRT